MILPCVCDALQLLQAWHGATTSIFVFGS